MGNQQSLSADDIEAMETSGRHLNDHKDPQVKSMSKRLDAIKVQICNSGSPPDIKALFDQLAVDGKIDKTNFAILLRGTFNFAVKNAIGCAVHGPSIQTIQMQAQQQAQEKASNKEAITKAGYAIQELGEVPAGAKATAISAVAVAIKAANRLDLHSTKILDRIFAFLDKDSSGSLGFDELQAFVGEIMTNPQAAIDPFRFIGGAGADKITVDQIVEIFNDVFMFSADMMIQFIDLFEEVLTSHDVLHAFEIDDELWKEFFGVAGGNGKISKDQFKQFIAQAPWEIINEQFKSQINSPANAAMWDQNMAHLREAKDAVLAGISETGSAEEGLARAYAWLNNGVDETTFMSNVLPSLRKFIQSKNTPEAQSESIKAMVTQIVQEVKEGPPEVRAQLGPALAIFQKVQFQVEQPGFLEAILSQPQVKQVMESFSKTYEQKLPIILHHCFRFCDINSDNGVSEAEMKVLFALKDSLASGKLDEAAVHIFEVIDKDGNGEISPSELLSFFSKLMHFMCSIQRIYVSMIFENLVPEIIKAALPAVCAAMGLTEVTKEQLPGVMMMAQMQMLQAQGMAMAMAAPPEPSTTGCYRDGGSARTMPDQQWVVAWHVNDHAECAVMSTEADARAKYSELNGGSWACRLYDPTGRCLEEYGCMGPSDWKMLEDKRAQGLVAEGADEPVAESAGKPMRITVRPLNQEAEELKVNGSDIISNVKECLQERMGLSASQMVLVKGRKPLLDDLATLESLDIADGTLLTLIVRGFPPPTIKDSEKITKLAQANDVAGLRQAALEGYDLNVIASAKDSPMDALYPTLHTAIYQDNCEMMKLVLETGVSVFSLTHKNPKTALQVAAKWGNKDMCEWLITYGLDPHEGGTMTSDGSNKHIMTDSAIEYAEYFEHGELAAWLKEQQPPTTTYSVIE